MPTQHDDSIPSDKPRPSALTLKAALDSLRDELARMPASEVSEHRNLNASTAAGIVSGHLPRIMALRDVLTRQFGAEGARYLDLLPTIALATEQASIELAAADRGPDLAVLHSAILEDHALLLGDADSLANRKLLHRDSVDAGRPIQGYRTAVSSTLVLVTLLRKNWSKVEHATPLRAADVDAIELRAQEMIRLLNEREVGSTRTLAADTKIRALSRLVRVYEEVRRMIRFVRHWEDDAEQIAPSLWSGRRGRTRAARAGPDGADPPRPAEPTAPAVRSPVNGGDPFTT